MAAPNLFDLLGNELQGKDGPVSADFLKEADYVCVYFSAHWCPPCRGFTPVLIEWYNEYKENGKKFEVVFVSSDRDEPSFNDYYKDMPWHALPFSKRDDKGKVCSAYGVSGIPTFIVFNGKGELVNKNGRGIVQSGKYLE